MIEMTTCRECGGLLPEDRINPPAGMSPIRYCGPRCRKKAHRRADHNKARAKAAGSPVVDRVDPLSVFERDGWRCRLCGCATPHRLMGTRSKAAPTLDHIRPLKHKGHHTMANVRLTCSACNFNRDQRMKRLSFKR